MSVYCSLYPTSQEYVRSNVYPALKQMENVIAKAIIADMTGSVFGTATSYYKTNMKGYLAPLITLKTL